MQRVNEFAFYDLATKLHKLTALPDKLNLAKSGPIDSTQEQR